MSFKKIIVIHILIFLVLELIFFLLSETLIKILVPEIHNVIFWLYLLLFGTIIVFVLLLISLIICFKFRRKIIK